MAPSKPPALAAPGANLRRIAVVPAYNEEPTVGDVLGKLYGYVDELVVVDDGSTDGTKVEIERFLVTHPNATMLVHEVNQGMSEAYYLAFTDLRHRLAAGELSPDDLVYTVDADGQHDLAVLDDLHDRAVEESLDALIVRRDLSTYPPYKQAGNWVMSTWATMWSGGVPLHDVESGYRIFRLGALADALSYYKGYKYSETVEVAIVLSRLGYRVRNDILVPVPVFRSRTRMKDVVIDLAMMVVAAVRVTARRPKDQPVPSLVPPVAKSTAIVGAAVLPPALVARALWRRARR
jgi:glycosyltransferase involved in cell wall biosynthesis